MDRPWPVQDFEKVYQVLRAQLLDDPLVGGQPDFACQHMGKVSCVQHAASRPGHWLQGADSGC